METTSKFVESLYEKVLYRTPDKTGLTYWEEQLEDEQISVTAITNSFISSEEFHMKIAPIVALYYFVLGREPDQEGLEYWIEESHKGVSTAKIASYFMESNEYSSLMSNDITDENFIEKLYTNGFNRESDAEGKAYWLDCLKNGTTKEEVIVHLATSKESQLKHGNDIKTLLLNIALTNNEENIGDLTFIENINEVINYLFNSTHYSGAEVPGATGIVSDGYISGATVFADENGDGVWNEGEVKTITDENGDFTLVGGSGSIVAIGGTDISTGIAFEGVFTAPEGSDTVSPITTLIDQVIQSTANSKKPISKEEASLKVAKFLGLSDSIDLLSFDPIKTAKDSSLSLEEKEQASLTQTAAVKVVNMMSQSASALQGAGIIDEQEGATAAASALASMIIDEKVSNVDFSSSKVVEEFLEKSSQIAGASVEQVEKIKKVAPGISVAILNINNKMSEIKDSNLENLFQQLANVQIAAENIENLIEKAANSGSADSVKKASDISNLEKAIKEVAKTGEVPTTDYSDDNTGSSDDDTPSSPPSNQTRNNMPTVEAPLSFTISEDALEYPINLLLGATDKDKDAILHVESLNENSKKEGWKLQGEKIIINGDYFNELDEGDIEQLEFNYKIVDEHGAKVNQTLVVNIEGNNTPSLSVEVLPGALSNESTLKISSSPDTTEQVNLIFVDLPTGVTIKDLDGKDVSSGIDDYSGTNEFTLSYPSDQDIQTDTLVIKATAIDSDNKVIADTEQAIKIGYDVNTSDEALNFSSVNQNIWGDFQGRIDWHEYLPLVGGEIIKWNEEEQKWEDDASVEKWSSGEFNVVNIDLDSETILPMIQRIAQNIIDEAKDTFDATAYVVDAGVQDAFDEAEKIYNKAKDTFEAAAGTVDEAAQKAFDAAKNTYNEAKNTYNEAKKYFDDTVVAAFNVAKKLFEPIRHEYEDLHHWLAFIPYKVAKLAFAGAEAIYKKGQDVLDAAEHEFDVVAKKAYNKAKAAYNEAKGLVNEAAKTIFDTAEEVFEKAKDTYESAKEVVLNAAQTVYDGVKNKVDASVEKVTNTIDFESQLKVDAELKGEVGVQVDFELDLGSVDTDIDYILTTDTAYNQTNDTLMISPTMTNQTTGESVAFNTISPNVKFYAALLYDVGADLNVYLDGKFDILDQSIFDLSPDSEGIDISTTISTSAWKDMLEEVPESDRPEIEEGIESNKIVLVDFDSTEGGPFKVPFVEKLTQDILDIELNLPTVITEGKSEDYNKEFFEEGKFLNVDFSEISSTFFNLVEAKLDYSDELKELYNLESFGSEKTIADAIDSMTTVILETVWDLIDGKSEGVPIFVMDATDETSTSLLHINAVPDTKITSTLTDDTANFGFYTAYGESDPVLKFNIDVDAAVALIANEVIKAVAIAASAGTASAIKAIPTINPLNLSFGIDEILEMVEVPEETRKEITEFVDLGFSFESADIDVNSEVDFSQEFSLSLDDMVYTLFLENGETKIFSANDTEQIILSDASSYDVNGDGNVDYNFKIIPKAMFSNDTEIGLSMGYSLEFLQAALEAQIKFPLDKILGEGIKWPELKLPLADIELGPLFSMEGDLDVLDVDLFESRFEIDVGSNTTEIQTIGVSETTMFS